MSVICVPCRPTCVSPPTASASLGPCYVPSPASSPATQPCVASRRAGWFKLHLHCCPVVSLAQAGHTSAVDLPRRIRHPVCPEQTINTTFYSQGRAVIQGPPPANHSPTQIRPYDEYTKGYDRTAIMIFVTSHTPPKCQCSVDANPIQAFECLYINNGPRTHPSRTW